MKPIVRIYSGREGCMCGCRGKYYEPTDRGFKRVLNALLKQKPNLKQEDSWVEASVGNRVYVGYFS